MILGGQPPGKAGRRWGRLLKQKPLYSSLAQSVERMTVNHDVVGSSPTRGAKLWPLGQVVKTPPFHGDNMGSNPVGVTKKKRQFSTEDCRFFLYQTCQVFRINKRVNFYLSEILDKFVTRKKTSLWMTFFVVQYIFLFIQYFRYFCVYHLCYGAHTFV